MSFGLVPKLLILLIGTQLTNAANGQQRAVLTQPTRDNSQAADRTFTFQYGFQLKNLKQGDRVQVWIPKPQSTPFQKVSLVSADFPVKAKETQEGRYGNQMFYFEQKRAGSSELPVKVNYLIKRKEASVVASLSGSPLPEKEARLFLAPNKMVPTTGKPVEVFQEFLDAESIELPKDPMMTGKLMYDFVEGHMKYDKSKPGYGKGDSVWACDSRTGNCTDFHSLFISVARANRVPAQFRIGFPVSPKRGAGKVAGYHCWAYFYTSKGWVPVDISEADKDPTKKDYYFGNLSEDRVHFTTGRDLILEPAQNGKPLNYFVYPYVEVNGKPLAKENIQLDFRYEDKAK